MAELRATERLQNYWKQLCKSDKMPRIQQFNHMVVADVWPYCMQIGIRNDEYRYEYIGEALAELYGEAMTGQTFDMHIKRFPAIIVTKKLPEVLSQRAPATDNGHMFNKSGDMIRYRCCMLPFGTEKQGVTHIIAGLSYKQF